MHQTVTCDNCGPVDAIFGRTESVGQYLCLACAQAAGWNIPATLTRPTISDPAGADLAEYRAQKAAEKRAKLDAFLVSRGKAPTKAPENDAPALGDHASISRPAPVAIMKTAPTTATQLRLI